MAEDINITGPVKIQGDSKERVAFDLMMLVYYDENIEKQGRIYWLTLYHQCLMVVAGRPPESILK